MTPEFLASRRRKRLRSYRLIKCLLPFGAGFFLHRHLRQRLSVRFIRLPQTGHLTGDFCLAKFLLTFQKNLIILFRKRPLRTVPTKINTPKMLRNFSVLSRSISMFKQSCCPFTNLQMLNRLPASYTTLTTPNFYRNNSRFD